MQEITEALEGAPFIPKVRLGFLNNHSKSVYSVYSVVLISESRMIGGNPPFPLDTPDETERSEIPPARP